MKINIVLEFPEGTSEEVAKEVASTIASAMISDLQAFANGGMTVEEAFGEGMVAPTSVKVEVARKTELNWGPQQGSVL